MLSFEINYFEPGRLTITGLPAMNKYRKHADALAAAIQAIDDVTSCIVYDNHVIDVLMGEKAIIDLVAKQVVDTIRGARETLKTKVRVRLVDIPRSTLQWKI